MIWITLEQFSGGEQRVGLGRRQPGDLNVEVSKVFLTVAVFMRVWNAGAVQSSASTSAFRHRNAGLACARPAASGFHADDARRQLLERVFET